MVSGGGEILFKETGGAIPAMLSLTIVYGGADTFNMVWELDYFLFHLVSKWYNDKLGLPGEGDGHSWHG